MSLLRTRAGIGSFNEEHLVFAESRPGCQRKKTEGGGHLDSRWLLEAEIGLERE